MNRKWKVLAIGLGLALVLSTAAVPASADGRSRGSARTMRSVGKALGSSSRHRSVRTPSFNRGHSSSMSRSSNSKIWNNLGSSKRSGDRSSKFHGSDWGNFLGGLGGFGGYGGFPMGDYGYFNGYGDRHHRDEDSMADAYREVGMTHAVVNLIGIIAETATATAQNNNYYRPAQSSGHWERQAVILQPARQEQYEVYVEPLYDQRTGQKISGGYNETRTRTVPEVIQYRDVWVPEGVPR